MASLMLSPRGRRYGYIPAPARPSDLGFPSRIVTHTGVFPARAFLRGAIGDVKNQKSQGSCDGHACTSMGERLYRRWKGLNIRFSPAYSYYMERKLEGTLDQGDCGAMITSALIVPDPRAPGGSGWCPEYLMPYDESDFSTAPSTSALKAAAVFPGGAYHSLGNNIENMKACIMSDYSFVIGIAVYQSFEGDAVATNGLVPFPNVNVEQLLGGHALHAGIGFDDTIQCPSAPNPGAIMVQNSWGTGWGCPGPGISITRGFAWIPYDYLLNPNLTSDVRMGHLGRPWG